MIRTGLIAALVLIATPALAQETPRYTLTVSVVREGVQVPRPRLVLVQNRPAAAPNLLAQSLPRGRAPGEQHNLNRWHVYALAETVNGHEH